MTKEEILIALKEGRLSTSEASEKLHQLRENEKPSEQEQAGDAQSSPPSVPLSEGQEGLWMLQQFSPEMNAYNIPLAFRVKQPLNIPLFEKACEHLLEECPVLRTVIKEEKGVPYQTIDPNQTLAFHQESITDLDEENIISHVRTRAKIPFNLETGPLMRVHLFCRSPQETIVLLTLHHIIFDGTSAVLFFKSLWSAYRDYTEGRQPGSVSVKSNYHDYVNWEREMLRGEEGQELAAYWKQQLGGELPTLSLPTDRPRAAVQSFRGDTYATMVSPELSEKIQTFAKSRRINTSLIFLATFKVLLNRYTRQNDILVGMPTIGRPQQRFEETLGHFINMIVIRSQVTGSQSFAEFLKQLQWTMVDGMDHSAYPFPKLVRDLNLQLDRTVSPLFQVSFSYQNFIQSTDKMTADNHFMETLTGIYQEGDSEFGLEVFERQDRYELNVIHSPDLFDAATIERMMTHYTKLLGEVLENPDLPTDDYEFLAPEEKQSILLDWNETRADYPDGKCMHELFEEQVRKAPSKVAVISGNVEFTYREIDDKSNKLALHLQKLGIKPDTLVGISLDRSAEMITAMLGVLKAGGAYVPVDPENPDVRLKYVLKESQVKVLVTQEKLLSRVSGLLPDEDCTIIAMDKKWPEIAKEEGDLERAVQSQHLAYVIYTSGSTGKPKAVMLEHRMIHQYTHAITAKLSLNRCKSFALASTFYADLGYTMLWPALTTGGCLHILSQDVTMNGDLFRRYFLENDIDCLKITPSHFASLQDFQDGEVAFPSKMIIFGGETCPPQLITEIQNHAETCQVYNHYGPTESSVGVTVFPIKGKDATEGAIPIGKPLPNVQIYILNARHQPVPVGVAGDLYVSGGSIARGYLNQPKVSHKNFIDNPFNPGTRMYKTGDLAKWLPDGNIAFLGRVDRQVKIRGYRIEVGEIETVLLGHPNVREAVVITNSPMEDTQLIAYYVSEEQHEASEDQVRGHLQDSLPDHMIPTAFFRLDAIPLTPNGKVDREALLQQDHQLASSNEFVAPQTEVEKELAAIWEEVLGVEQVGLTDNFFDLGGHSLRAIQVISRIKKQLSVDVPLQQLFEAPNIKALADAVAQSEPVSPDDHIAEFVEGSTEITI